MARANRRSHRAFGTLQSAHRIWSTRYRWSARAGDKRLLSRPRWFTPRIHLLFLQRRRRLITRDRRNTSFKYWYDRADRSSFIRRRDQRLFRVIAKQRIGAV